MESIAHPSDYSKYWMLLRRRWLPALVVTASVFTFSALSVTRKPDVFRASGTLIYKSQTQPEDLIGLAPLTGSGGQSDKAIATELAVLKSTPILQQVLQEIATSAPVLPSVDSMKSSLSVNSDSGTDLVRISFDSGDPQLAKEVVNRLMQLFLQRNIRENRARSIAAGEFIAGQLPEVRRNVFMASDALRRFQEANGLLLLDNEMGSAAQSDLAAKQSLAAVQAEIAGVEEQLSDLRQQLDLASVSESLAASDLNQSAEAQQAIAEFRRLRQELLLARTDLTSSHPRRLDLELKKQELSQKLAQLGIREVDLENQESGPELGETRQGLANKLIDLELQQKGLVEQRSSLLRQQQGFSSRVAALPGIQHQFRELQRELQAAERTYDTLLGRLQEVRVTENQALPNVEIIEPAQIPQVPVLPNRTMELMRGAIAAVLLGYVTAYLLERLDRRIKTVEDVRAVYPLPVLGTIPELLRSKEEGDRHLLPVRNAPGSSVAEAYRMLQANLKFLQSDHPLKVVAVSSAITGEGKSTTVANLGLALAESHRVLLIDAHLRRPSQHQIWEHPNHYGLSNLLADLERPFSTLLGSNFQLSENISLLPAGVVPPNPVTLLESHRMQHLLDWAKESFDYVIVDLPPVSVAADALFVGKMADGMLLVGRPEKLDRPAAKLSFEAIQQAQVNLLGVMVNSVILRNEPNSYYYYYSYYRNHYYSESEQSPLRPRKATLSHRISDWVRK
ncbi:GumC family protein [Lyngbya confervoides]|uniref:non-specific protein-tyrosine kinase n=1 Tax=Lyngbya confervoides BDU141951 TaxID=1574623 RepID=A0ABD4T3U1_9CYAN|nr:polysaccharide biosynthesis tyrosine autokinase [Lyngbya confervoides]MCM1982990.1 polysaccharide biosynthesis tyrosine autokinase [Lyngbya confervoides BDU141951]